MSYRRSWCFAVFFACLTGLPTFAQTISWQYAFNPASPALLTLGPSDRLGIFHQSDAVAITASNNAAIRVIRYDNALIYSGSPTTRTYPPGHYFVETNGDRNQFVVLPDDYAGAEFLGSPANTLWSVGTARNARVQPCWARLGWESLWQNLEPQQGVMNWTDLDNRMSQNIGKKVILMTAGQPAWVTDSQFLSGYVSYVQAIVNRYPGKIYAVEVWNEPYYGSFPTLINNSFVDTYVQLAKDVAAGVHAIDPTIKIFGPAWSEYRMVETQQMISLGLLDAIDGFSWHDYSMGAQAPDSYYWDANNLLGYTGLGKVPTIFGSAKSFRDLMPGKMLIVDELALYGKSSIGIPDTSTEVLYLSPLDWQRGMYRTIKATAMFRAAGVDCIIPHNLILDSPSLAQVDESYGWEGPTDRGPHPKTSGLLMCAYWLKGASFVDYRTPGGRLFLYSWRRANGTSVLFAWSAEGQPVALKAGTAIPATDIFGRSIVPTAIGEAPILFTSTSSDAEALLQSVMGALNEYINTPPTTDPLGCQNTLYGQTLQFRINADDLDNDPLTYSVTPLPAGASLNAATGVFTWTPTQAQVGSYQLQFTVVDARGASTSRSVPVGVLTSVMDGLIHRWKLDEGTGTTTADSVGSSSGTLLNFNSTTTSGWVTGHNGQALSFDGVDDYVTLNPTPDLAVTNGFTVDAWIAPHSLSSNGTILGLCTQYLQSGVRLYLASGQLKVEGLTPSGVKFALFNTATTTLDAWNHVAFVYDQSTVHGYLNGVPLGVVDFGSSLVMIPTRRSVLGYEYGNAFSGKIDEVRVFRRPMGDAEIVALYQGTSLNVAPVLNPIGAKQVTATQNLSFTIAGTDANSNTLTYTATGLPSGATFNASTRTFSWTPTSTQVGTYTVTFSVSDGSLSDSELVAITVNTAPPSGGGSSGLLADWPLDEGSGTTATDIVGGHNGQLANFNFNATSGWVNLGGAGSGSALYFDGINDYVYMTGGTLGPVNNFSVSAWVYPAAAAGRGTIFALRTRYAISGMRVLIDTGHLQVDAQTTAGAKAATFTGASVTPGAWNQVTVVYDNGTVRGYVNGVAVGSATWAASLVVDLTAYSKLGMEYSNYFQGAIDEVKVHDHALTAAEVLTLYQDSSSVTPMEQWNFDEGNGLVTYDSVNGTAADLRNFAFTQTSGWTAGKTGTALSFDGVDDYVAFSGSTIEPSNNFTFAAWVYPRNATTLGTVMAIRTRYAASGIRFLVDSGYLKAEGQTTAGARVTTFTGLALTPNTWNHVAVVYNNGTVSGYVNGVAAGSGSWAAPLVIDPTAYSKFGMEYNNPFNGLIDDVELFDSPLAGTDITALAGGQPSNPPNSAPTLAAIGNKSVVAGQNLSFTISATDPNGNPLTYSATGLPSGATFNTSTHTFSWTPTSTQTGNFSTTFTVSDGTLTDSETITITVTAPTNSPPVLAAIGNKSVVAGQNLSFTISATDPNGNPLTYSATGLPSGATFNTSTHTFSWTPTSTQTGNFSTTFTVSDGTLTDSETITITVTNVNRPPTLAAIGNKSVNEGQALSFTISGSDPDGNTLTYSASGLPTGATFTAATQAFSWTPDYTQAGTYSVTFAVSDGSLTASQTITITVANVNRPPTLTAIGNKSVNEAQTLSFAISGSDPDGNTLTYSASGLPSGATFNTSTHTFNWTPDYTQAGTYSVTFAVSDGSLTASQTITITVANVNRPPTLTAIGNKSVNEGQALSFTISGSDPDGNTLTYSASGLPSGATFNTSTHTFSWAPNYTQAGTYSVTFAVSDGSLTASQTITITVANVNQPPVLNLIGNRTVSAKSTLTFSISATDPDGDSLSYSASGLPSGATFDPATHTFSWSTKQPNVGTYLVTFQASDGSLSDSETITISVQ